MSRKANNLKKRLRIEQEQYAKRDANLKQREKALAMAEVQWRKEEADIRRSAALSIRFSAAPYQCGDMFTCTVTFRPEMFMMAARYSEASSRFPARVPSRFGDIEAMNVSAFARMQGREIAERVTQGIIDYVTKGGA